MKYPPIKRRYRDETQYGMCPSAFSRFEHLQDEAMEGTGGTGGMGGGEGGVGGAAPVGGATVLGITVAMAAVVVNLL